MTVPPQEGPERVLAEALRVMAGGERPVLADETGSGAAARAAGAGPHALRLHQLMLLAAIVGLLAGIIAGLLLA